MLNAVYAIVLLPLVGFAVLLVGGRRLGEPASGRLATVMVALSFVATCVAFAGLARKVGKWRRKKGRRGELRNK